MPRLVETVERVIPAQPERIWALVADPRRHQDINGNDTVREAFDVPPKLSVGCTFGMNMEFGGSYQMVSTVIEYDEGRRIAWQSRPVATGAAWRQMFGGRIWRYELEPADGGTLVRESWDLTQEGRLGLRYVVWAYRRKTKQNMEHTLDRIASLATEHGA